MHAKDTSTRRLCWLMLGAAFGCGVHERSLTRAEEVGGGGSAGTAGTAGASGQSESAGTPGAAGSISGGGSGGISGSGSGGISGGDSGGITGGGSGGISGSGSGSINGNAAGTGSAAPSIGGSPGTSGAASVGGASGSADAGEGGSDPGQVTGRLEESLTYVKASNSEAGDHNGHSIALWGDYLAVGAPEESSATPELEGSTDDNSAPAAGAVFVYRKLADGTWKQEAYLKAPHPDADDQFGYSVALQGNSLVVGAPGEASGSDTVNEGEAEDDAPGAGAAYVFVREDGGWALQAYLKAPNSEAEDAFGAAVGIGDDLVVVGAPLEDSNAIEVNGNQTDNSQVDSGAAYLFTRTGSAWAPVGYLKSPLTAAGDQFGNSVAATDWFAAVGCSRESEAAGGVHVYWHDGASLVHGAQLRPDSIEPGDEFGSSLAVFTYTLAIGAPKEDSGSTGVNGDPSDNSAEDSGAVFLYDLVATGFVESDYLKASNAGPGDLFGSAVAIGANVLAVGAPAESNASGGLDGDASDDSLSNAGAAYRFVRSPAGWSEDTYVKSPYPDSDDFFGYAVAISTSDLAVGAWGEGSSARGIGGDASNDEADDSGAAFVWAAANPGCSIEPTTDQCDACSASRCCREFASWNENEDRAALALCLDACSTAQCRNDCLASHPVGVAVEAEFDECQAENCDIECGALGEAIRQYALVYCTKFSQCASWSFGTSLGTEEDCVARTEKHWAWIARLPGVAFDADDMLDCSDAWTARPCNEYGEEEPAECYVPGTGANGAPCIDGLQCASTFCEHEGWYCGTCTDPPSPGDPCPLSSDCGRELWCGNGITCERSRDLNESCDGTYPCRIALACHDGICVLPPAELGVECDYEAGLDCAWHQGYQCSPATNRCLTVEPVEMPSEGSDCAPFGGCRWPARCSTTGTCELPDSELVCE